MKRIFISALALLGMGVMANAQEKVTIHNGSESYVTNVEYITFDATDADDAVSVSALQTEITTLTGEKTTLEGQVSTLTSEKAELATAKTTLEGQVSTLTSEKEVLESDLAIYKQKYLKLVTNGHDYVDLGLTSGTLWATCNVGADAPESYGDYFAWGETEPHYSAGGNTKTPTWKEGYSAGYNWSTYKWCNGSSSTITKYCTSSSYGTVDNKTELEDADDVAVQAWGGAWSMPTKTQQDELRNECYWVWTTSYNGKSVNGYIVYKAKSDSDKGQKIYSGNTPSADYDVATDAHIFLPAAGFRNNGSLSDVGRYGFYWSRSLGTNNSSFVYLFRFYSSDVDTISSSRLYGQPVRPVCPGK